MEICGNAASSVTCPASTGPGVLHFPFPTRLVDWVLAAATCVRPELLAAVALANLGLTAHAADARYNSPSRGESSRIYMDLVRFRVVV